ncbi:MAG: glycoside hydrolase family 3 C-terminal domain-containing protein, partial [Candidatus Sumerlaeota bacterium]
SADAVILAVGESPYRVGEASNVATLDPPAGQDALIEALGRRGVPLIVVVCAARPLSINSAAQHADAILYAWHPGSMGADAIADVLAGKANPSGKLPTSILRSVGQIPLHYQKKNTGHPRRNDYYTDESWYQDVKGSPLYPFGYGLSYTCFEYSNIELDKSEIDLGESITVSALLENVGERAGEEVAQCYIRDLVAETTRPVRELKGFQKVALEPGASRKVSFTLGPDELSFCGRDGKRKVEVGEFHVWIGGSCLAKLQAKFTVK